MTMGRGEPVPPRYLQPGLTTVGDTPMTFFSKPEKAPPPDLVGDIKRKLEAEQSRCAELSGKNQSVAFEAETTGDRATLNDLAFDISKSRGRIETLEAANCEAKKRCAMAKAQKLHGEVPARSTVSNSNIAAGLEKSGRI